MNDRIIPEPRSPFTEAFKNEWNEKEEAEANRQPKEKSGENRKPQPGGQD